MNPGCSSGLNREQQAAPECHSGGSRMKRQSSTGSVSKTDRLGRTELHWAAIEDDETRLVHLLEEGFDTRATDREGSTPLHLALRFQKSGAAEILAGADAGNCIRDKKWKTPLHLAAMWGYPKVVRMLLSAGPDVHLQNNRGDTPLHIALRSCNSTAMDFLPENADDIEDPNEHFISGRERECVARNMLYSGMHPHVKNAEGQFPLHVALERLGFDDLTKMILAACALRGLSINWSEMGLPHYLMLPCKGLFSQCETETRLMRNSRIEGSNVSFYDLATKHVGRLTPYLRTESVLWAFHSSVPMQHFPLFADFIQFKLEQVEERKVLAARCLEGFSRLPRKLPEACTDVILLCLSNADMRNFARGLRC